MAKNKTIIVKGVEITIIKQYDNDYISITDMLKLKTVIFLSPIGSETATQLSSLAFGKVSATRILIMANLPQLEVRQG